MNVRLSFAIITTKILIKTLRLLKLGGTTLPGKVARKIYPNIASEISKDFYTIMVTGTNGKTTTSRIISQVLTKNDILHITNKSGANLVSGVITTFIEAVNLNGKSSIKTALIEIDEAAFKVISDFINPNILVVTNFFRDQLDRYGELYSTLNSVKCGIEKSPKTSLILNADDSLCASLGKNNEDRKITYYGVSGSAYKGSEESANTDAMFCLYCKGKYDYTAHFYGHLGIFKCPDCGYERPNTEITCEKITELTSSYSCIELSFSNAEKPYNTKINLPGLYNVYNALAAAALGQTMELPIEKSIEALESFECGFGRMETIQAGNKTIKLILVKNPTGFNQVINYLLTEDKQMQVAFAINDNLADGTDISWLWDVDFEKLSTIKDKFINIYTSGIRGEDMSVRLKYAELPLEKIKLIKDYAELIDEGLSKTPDGSSLYILPSYTAMLDIRKVLRKRFGLKEFWK